MAPVQRAYDAELAPVAPTLPTTWDFSDMPALRRELQAGVDAAAATLTIPSGVTFDDIVVAGTPDVKIRLYRPPLDSSAIASAQAAILYIHGGGFCVGGIDVEHAPAAEVAAHVGAVVASVEYRLAPEHPFPAALDDCMAALVWLVEHADELGVDRDRVAVMGQSAGAGIAAGLALQTRDRNGPELCFQLLRIPVLDDRLETESMLAFDDTPFWNRPMAELSWRFYLGEQEGQETSTYAAPARAVDLTRLPPAYITTMEFDPLRDEGILYALRLLQAGVSVELHQFPGTFHGSTSVPSEISTRIESETLNVLCRALAPR